MIDYTFPYFGPLLLKMKIDSDSIRSVKSLCNKNKTKDHRSELAGIIQHEYTISSKKFQTILEPYLKTFQYAHNQFYGRPLNPLSCNGAWVNYMQQKEYNPQHVHSNCDFSSVLYLDIPNALIEENNKYKGQSIGPGGIGFYYGEFRNSTIVEHCVFPQAGELFIFPFNLRHEVMPFKSKCERISVAANFVCKNEKVKRT